MSARSVCSGRRPCRYHSDRAISFPFRRPLALQRAHTCRIELLLESALDRAVFKQQLVVIAFHKPARLPRLGITQPKSVWMYLLSPKAPVEALLRTPQT